MTITPARAALSALVLIALPLITSCASEPETQATPTPPASSAASTSQAQPSPSAATSHTPPPQPAPAVAEEKFVAFLKEEGYLAEGEDGADAVNLGQTICWGYDNGATYADLEPTLTSGSWSPSQARGFNGAAIIAFCPQHVDKVTG